MITIFESYFLKAEHTPRALVIFQELDHLLGPNAHSNVGHVGHASFLQDLSDPAQVRLIYQWRDRASFSELVRGEEPLLADFLAKYCTRPRLIQIHEQLPVEVDHHDDEPAQM